SLSSSTASVACRCDLSTELSNSLLNVGGLLAFLPQIAPKPSSSRRTRTRGSPFLMRLSNWSANNIPRVRGLVTRLLACLPLARTRSARLKLARTFTRNQTTRQTAGEVPVTHIRLKWPPIGDVHEKKLVQELDERLTVDRIVARNDLRVCRDDQ